MTDTQKIIKQTIENYVKTNLGSIVVVEYVSDVSARASEIVSAYPENFYNAYEATHFTGTFIPQVGDNPFYILIQEDRPQCLDVMTAFHEYQHLLDYVCFLSTACHNDINYLRNNPLYKTFNIYSEFSATKTGIIQYARTVTLGTMSLTEKCEGLLETYCSMYRRFEGIETRYQLLVHCIQFFGCITAASMIDPSYDISPYFEEIEFLSELSPVFNVLTSFEDSIDWYEHFDRIARIFVG